MLINSLTFRQGAPCSGHYRIHSPRYNNSAKNGSPYISLVIGDMTGSLKSYIWINEYEGPRDLAENERVSISGKLRYFNDQWMTVIHTLTKAGDEMQSSLPLIPVWWCPIGGILPRLHELVTEIDNKPLRTFLNRMFADDSIALPFVSLPGSNAHHHITAGGLIKHSLECAEIVRALPFFSTETRELGVVAALLHDVGKIRTLSNTGSSQSGYLLSHDAVTLEIMAPHFRLLDRYWPDGATALRYLLTWKDHRQRPFPLMTIAEAVNLADRLSCGLDREFSAFSDLPAWRNAGKSGLASGFWRPQSYVATIGETEQKAIAS